MKRIYNTQILTSELPLFTASRSDFLSRHYGIAKNSRWHDKKNKSLLYNIINQTLLQEGQV